jgi:hypothetical protein
MARGSMVIAGNVYVICHHTDDSKRQLYVKSQKALTWRYLFFFSTSLIYLRMLCQLYRLYNVEWLWTMNRKRTTDYHHHHHHTRIGPVGPFRDSWSRLFNI